MKKRFIAIASFLLTLIPLAAKANYDALHINLDPYTNLDYKFVVPGIPAQIREFKYEATKQSIINTDNCGWKEFYIDSTTSSLIAIDNYTVAASETQTFEPMCRAGTGGYVVQSPFNTKPVGYSVKVANSFWVKFGDGVQSKTVSIKYTKLKKVTIGECGFYAFQIPSDMTGTTVKLDGIDSTVSSIPRTSGRELCLKVGMEKKLYRPLNF